MTPKTREYNLRLTEDERAELVGILERELADLSVECRHTDTPAYRDQLRDEEIILRFLAAKLRQLSYVAAPLQSA